MTGDDRILLGTLAKTHGVQGELVLRIAETAKEPDKSWELVFLRMEGIPVPFFIESLREFRGGEWLIKFDWYETRDRAEKLVGNSVWVPAAWTGEEKGRFSPEELTGFDFMDTGSGETGTITAYLDIPGNPVFELQVRGRKVLVPARDDLVLEADPARRLIIFDIPPGLI